MSTYTNLPAFDDLRFQGDFLGVLGGMGPLAGAQFMLRLVSLTQASVDQEHVPAILWNDPRVPDRQAGQAGLGPDPLPWMLHGVARLTQAGASAIAIPCNTAHVWHAPLARAAGVPVFHIVDAVLDDLRRQGVMGGRVGLLGTATTLRLGLYQRALDAQGYVAVVPPADVVQGDCARAIRLIKENRSLEALAPTLACVEYLRTQQVDAIVLGCTELPLALPHSVRAGLGIVITDSIDALALACIAWRGRRKPQAKADAPVVESLRACAAPMNGHDGGDDGQAQAV